jgi:outer membrane protein OmpA-like peptidoglycan-associated protein
MKPFSLPKNAKALRQQGGGNMRHLCEISRVREVLAIMYRSDVIFEWESAILKPSAHEEIGRVANMINLFPHMPIDVEVSLETDGFETPGQGGLQKKRALALRDALLRQGIDSERVQRNAHGASRTSSLRDTVNFKVIDPLMDHSDQVPMSSYLN